MKRYGAVIVFREGLSKERAAECFGLIRDGLDLKGVEDVPSIVLLQTFDSNEGFPVWYIP